MQINLLDDSRIDSGDFNRQISRARSKKCLLNEAGDFSIYQQIQEAELIANPKLKEHVASVFAALDKKGRKYNYLNPMDTVEGSLIFNDSHNEIEKLGYHRYLENKKIVIISMEDYLDIALQKCCGANPTKIRTLKDYHLISFYFMNLCLDKYSLKFNLKQFRGLEPNFDAYLESALSGSLFEEKFDENEEDEYKKRNIHIFLRLYYGVILAATTILMNCTMILYKECHLSIRSQGFSNFVFNSLDLESNIPNVIHYTDKDIQFDLPVKIYGKGEYLADLRGMR